MRARNIKPGFFKNEHLLECDPLARILFAGLWCMADREGRLEDRPKRIKIELLPCDNCDADGLMQQLHDHGLIVRYEVAGERYVEIPTFNDHQAPHSREQASTIPTYNKPEEVASNDLGNGKHPLNPESPILNPDCSSAEEVRGRVKIGLDDLTVDHNAEWLSAKRSQGRYLMHDEHFVLEQFKQYCKAKGKKYANYLEAYRNAFEWEKCQPSHGNTKPNNDDRAKAAILRGLATAQAGFRGPEVASG